MAGRGVLGMREGGGRPFLATKRLVSVAATPSDDETWSLTSSKQEMDAPSKR